MTAGSSAASRRPSPAARVAFSLVRGYQTVMSALGRPSPCRFVPTCSMYALDAYEYHGFWHGTWLTARRLGRCHPWGRTGWDPVPALRGTPEPEPDRMVTSARPAANRRRKGPLR